LPTLQVVPKVQPPIKLAIVIYRRCAQSELLNGVWERSLPTSIAPEHNSLLLETRRQKVSRHFRKSEYNQHVTIQFPRTAATIECEANRILAPREKSPLIYLYMNYPNHRATIHGNAKCRSIRAARKDKPRISQINSLTLPLELRKFRNKEYSFSTDVRENDIWLEIDLQDKDIEVAVAKRLLQLAGRHYSPFRDLSLRVHC
jgi:hypothetical protein